VDASSKIEIFIIADFHVFWLKFRLQTSTPFTIAFCSEKQKEKRKWVP